MELPADVKQIVAAHAPHFTATAEGKVKCELNGHTFPAKADALNAFVNGKKYAKLAAQADLEGGLSKYEPFIVRSKNLPGMLFCALTGELLNARMAEVKHHLKGKKFARAKERFEADEQELLEEPDMEGSDMDEDGPEESDGPGIWLPEEVLREYEMGEAEEGEEDEEGQAAAAAAAGAAAGASDEAADEEGSEEETAAAAAAGKAQAKAAAASGKAGKGKANGKAAGNQQEKAGKGGKAAAAAADGGKQAAKKQASSKAGKQQQQQKKKALATNGTSGSGGKAKAPKAKRARTG